MPRVAPVTVRANTFEETKKTGRSLPSKRTPTRLSARLGMGDRERSYYAVSISSVATTG